MSRRKLRPDERQLGKSVEEHWLFPEVQDLLCHGLSPRAVVRTLEWQHRDHFVERDMPPLPSVRTIERWRKECLPAKHLLPPRLVEAKLKALDRKVDVFRSLEDSYRLAEARLARVIDTEEQVGIPLAAVDRAFETLLRNAELLWKVGQDVGVYPRWYPNRRAGTSGEMAVGGGPLIEEASEGEIGQAATAFHRRCLSRDPSHANGSP